MRVHDSAAAILVLTLPMIALPATTGLCQGPDDLNVIAAKLDGLADEMQLIEELNALQLSAPELAAVLEIVEDVQAATAPIIAARVAILKQLEPLLRAKRDALIADTQPAADLLAQILALEDQLGDLDARMDEAIVASAPRYRDVLTDDQVALVSGVEDARRQVFMLIEAMRDMPADKFNREAPGWARELEQLEAGLSAQRILDLFIAARNLSAEEYQQQGGEIVKGLMAIYAPRPEIADAMLAHFFADTRMPTILKDKQAAAANAG